MRSSRNSLIYNDPKRNRRLTEWDGPTFLDELEEELRTKTSLLEAEDYSALVDFLERVVDRRPDDAFSAKDLGEALVLDDQAERAIELLGPIHRRHPHFEDVQFVLLDALFALGRDEHSFDWVQEPVVLRLDAATVDRCLGMLILRTRPVFVASLYDELLVEGYLAFDEERLLEALHHDSRVSVKGEQVVWSGQAEPTGGNQIAEGL